MNSQEELYFQMLSKDRSEVRICSKNHQCVVLKTVLLRSIPIKHISYMNCYKTLMMPGQRLPALSLNLLG